jgi:divalent metal cation (Fe/Co/Zn/Cd) transporter
MDTALSDSEVETIKLVMQQFAGEYLSYHNMRTRRAGRECHIDLHLVARSEMSIKEVHDLCDEIEKEIEAQVPYCQVLIHVEPEEHAGQPT